MYPRLLSGDSSACIGRDAGWRGAQYAGIPRPRGPVERLSLAAWETTIRNLTSYFLMSRAPIPVMRRHQWGRIVNISSVVARGRPGANRSDYTASKVGVVGFRRVLADEVGRDGITVNCVAPCVSRRR